MTIHFKCRHFTSGNDIWFSAQDLCRGLEIADHLFAVFGCPEVGDHAIPYGNKIMTTPEGAAGPEAFVNVYGAVLLAKGRPKTPAAYIYQQGIIFNLIPDTVKAAGLDDLFWKGDYFARKDAEAAQLEAAQEAKWIEPA